MKKDEFFFELTPQRVLEAVESGGFSTTGHCMALNSLENRVYDVRLVDGSHIVAKFYRPGRWTEEQILEEHRFLSDLNEAEIPVCFPRSFPDGGTLRQVEGIYYALWPRTGGRAPDELGEEELAILGRQLARIHNVGSARESHSRKRLDAEGFAIQPLELLEERGFIPQALRDRIRRSVEGTAETFKRLSEGVPYHRIHGDCHLGNILHGKEGWFFLDFDDFLMGPAVQDLWMIVPARDSFGLHQREIFLSAYRQIREFEEHWLDLIEPLRAMRYIHYSAWIARRWEDPIFRETFPEFGSRDYWEKEARDLEDQIAHFHDGSILYPGVDTEKDAESELTNRDFFWDWEGD